MAQRFIAKITELLQPAPLMRNLAQVSLGYACCLSVGLQADHKLKSIVRKSTATALPA